MTRPLPHYLTAAEAADVLRVKPWIVSGLCKTGAIKATKPGKSWLITPEDLQAYIDAGANVQDVA